MCGLAAEVDELVHLIVAHSRSRRPARFRVKRPFMKVVLQADFVGIDGFLAELQTGVGSQFVLVDDSRG
jgi:hypothetical protein